MFCPRCHTELNEDMKFCPECGMKIEKCPACHEVIVPNAQFCSHCGTSLQQLRSQLDGYYQPLHESEFQSESEEIRFEDVSVNKKVNKKTVVLSTLIVTVLMIGSYFYIYHGPKLEPVKKPDTEIKTDILEIGSSTSSSSIVANINQGGVVYQGDHKIYMCDDHGYLISMDKNLQNRQTLLNKKCEYVQVVDDVIYYTDENYFMCQMDTDGKNQKILLNKAVYYLNYNDGKLFYQLDEEGKENIYVYDLKTNEQTKITDRQSYNINVLNDCIYYTSTDGIYKIGKDGKGEEKIIAGNVNSLVYQNEKLYYTLDYQVMSYDIKTQKTEAIVEETGIFLNITEKDIYYYTRQQTVKKYNLQTKEVSTVYNGTIASFSIVGDKLLIETGPSFQGKGFKVIMSDDGSQQQRLFVNQGGEFV